MFDRVRLHLGGGIFGNSPNNVAELGGLVVETFSLAWPLPKRLDSSLDGDGGLNTRGTLTCVRKLLAK